MFCHEPPQALGETGEGELPTAFSPGWDGVCLVSVADGCPLWSETYDRTLDDIFAVQDDIAQSVVKELRATLLGDVADSRASGEVRAEVARADRKSTRLNSSHRT